MILSFVITYLSHIMITAASIRIACVYLISVLAMTSAAAFPSEISVLMVVVFIVTSSSSTAAVQCYQCNSAQNDCSRPSSCSGVTCSNATATIQGKIYEI